MRETLYDPIRRRSVAATPEEQVRQRFIQRLLERGYPPSAIQVEYKVGKGRFDVAVLSRAGSLWLLAECKASWEGPTARQWLQTWTQLRRYAQALPAVHHFVVVWGSRLWCWKADTGELLEDLPPYPA
ncbi:MAG: hypothetical protein KatS3mg026_1430 [Bacteroidia bacterium]|nr:MAG: hypothetical protein KatS3mg026_1430 [Bacteroidia bacterium]